jgi:multiple sugar transport system permease protein
LDLRGKILTYGALLFCGGIFALPMWMMVSGSLQSPEQLARDPYSIPETWRWSNYAQAVNSMPMLMYLGNTLALCVGSVVGTTLSCSLVAYGLCKIDFRGRRLLMISVLATMLLP